MINVLADEISKLSSITSNLDNIKALQVKLAGDDAI